MGSKNLEILDFNIDDEIETIDEFVEKDEELSNTDGDLSEKDEEDAIEDSIEDDIEVDIVDDESDEPENSGDEEDDEDDESSLTDEKKEEKKFGMIAEILSWVLTVLVAVLLAVVLKNFVIINATVPTGSMENTILPDDDLFGIRLSYTFSDPKRGDIIIFKYPDNESELYIKRIIGLPGDKIKISNGKIYLNDSDIALEESYLKEEWTYENDNLEYVVPENSYFVLGDNRNRSWDSRFWRNKYVARDNIVAKAGYRYYPFNRLGVVK